MSAKYLLEWKGSPLVTLEKKDPAMGTVGNVTISHATVILPIKTKMQTNVKNVTNNFVNFHSNRK